MISYNEDLRNPDLNEMPLNLSINRKVKRAKQTSGQRKWDGHQYEADENRGIQKGSIEYQ